MKHIFLIVLLLCLLRQSAHAQQVIPLYTGIAPGSENWTFPEHTDTIKEWGDVQFVSNISVPTLTVFRPKGPIGTAVIVCPGGAFRGLAINKEGYDVAQWLNSKGVTAFVLKYRVVHAPPGFDPFLGRDMATGNFARIDSINAPFVPLAVADGREAVRYVRRHAAEFGVEPDRIGMMGFSAGGTLAASVAQTSDAESRPDFIAPIYAYCGAIQGDRVPADAPPIFLALAGDDPIANGNADLYKKWRDAGRPAELHIYPKGGHGFALRKQNLPCDLWPDRFMDWLDREGLLMTAKRLRNNSAEGTWRWHRIWDDMIHNDWAGLKRYPAANAELPPPAKNEKRVVFYGNSITEGWVNKDPDFFTKNNFVGRGIGGQTTGQMLVRFRQDVLDLKPAAVVILAGINDIAGNTGEFNMEATFGNLVSMAQLAQFNGIRVVLSSVLPASDFPWSPGREPAGKVIRLNAMLRDWAEKNNCVYLDYHTVMADEHQGLPASLASDGVHPTIEGYRIMEKLAATAVKQALKP